MDAGATRAVVVVRVGPRGQQAVSNDAQDHHKLEQAEAARQERIAATCDCASLLRGDVWFGTSISVVLGVPVQLLCSTIRVTTLSAQGVDSDMKTRCHVRTVWLSHDSRRSDGRNKLSKKALL